ncbi:MAG TPA: VOC family protein [Candidatus Didemnitutus sp.]|nr:VOC family protein [Candidatus Didemnitutus sp.]
MSACLAQVTFLVRDYDEAIDFFVGKLGFSLVEDSHLSATKRWVVVRPAGSAAPALLLARAVGERQMAAIGNQCGDRVGFFLHTDNFDRSHAAMTERGVRFLESPRTEAYGKVAVFADLYGNRWDLIEPHAASTP